MTPTLSVPTALLRRSILAIAAASLCAVVSVPLASAQAPAAPAKAPAAKPAAGGLVPIPVQLPSRCSRARPRT